MEVILSSGGMGYGHHWARGVQDAGYLRRIITSLNFKKIEGLDADRVERILLPELLGHVLWRMPGPNSLYTAYHIRDNLFDRWARRYIDGGDIFHVFNHFGLYSMRKAKSLGMRTLVERDSAHPVIQDDLMREEYQLAGLGFPEANQRLIPKHVQEYVEADFVTVPSEFAWRTMVEGGVLEDKLRMLPLGFDPERFEVMPDLKDDGVFRIIFVGAISLRKGVRYLLEAVRRMDRADIELVLVGGRFPDSASFLSDYEGLYREIGFVGHEELVRLYNSSAVFVLPSIEDGFGMVVYEAAACGLPVIVSENVGAPVRDGVEGYVVPIRDVDALAERLFTLYEDGELRRQMGEAARQAVVDATWENSIKRLIEIYEEMM